MLILNDFYDIYLLANLVFCRLLTRTVPHVLAAATWGVLPLFLMLRICMMELDVYWQLHQENSLDLSIKKMERAQQKMEICLRWRMGSHLNVKKQGFQMQMKMNGRALICRPMKNKLKYEATDVRYSNLANFLD